MAGFCCKFLRLAGVVALPCLALMSGAAMAEAQQAPAFDTSLPADYERSKLTDQINAYLDSLPKENVSEADLQQLQQLQQFLLQCQDLMKQQIEENQTMLDNLQSQSKGAAK